MKSINVKTNRRSEFINITNEVKQALALSDIKNGVVSVFVPHTTAGVTINENADPDVVSDMIKELDKIVPWADGYRHAEGNSAAHIKASFMGASVQLIVSDGKLQLGVWQGIYFCEFDGPRNRTVWIG